MLGASELPLRQGFACGKTLVRRKRAAPPCGAPVLSGIYTLRTRQNKRTSERMSFCFGLRPPKAVSALRDFNARGRQSRPCAKVFTCGENACTAHSRRRPEGRVGAVLSACREFENIQIVVTSQKRSTCYAGASFLDTWGSLNCSGEVNSPCAEVLPLAKRSNAAKAARPRKAVG